MPAIDPNLKLFLDALEQPVIICDQAQSLIYANPQMETTLGWKSEELLGKKLHLFSPDLHHHMIEEHILSIIRQKEDWKGVLSLQAKNGTYYNFATTAKAILNEGKPLLLYQLKTGPLPPGETSPLDPLTNLPNRELLLDRLTHSIESTKRVNKALAIMFLGLDRFHLINEGLGPKAGDQVLQEVARRLKTCVRSSDTVARYGGDRFAMVLQITGIDDGNIVARKILTCMSQPFDTIDETLNVSLSIGMSLYPADSADPQQLLEHAESAMHHAKREGGTQFTYFANEMNVRARTRLNLENRLRKAMENEVFQIYYQPKVAAENGRLVGAEALIRWHDEEQGFISPADFIPVAEETGLIVPIGTWVMRQCCLTNKAWQNEGLPKIPISVNVSSRQFRTDDFTQQVKLALEDSDLEPVYLELEITESMLISNIEQTIEKLQLVRKLGCQIAIDDFGTGYSSLSYLTRFPITTLKIDKSFVQGLEKNNNTEEVARAIIGLSKGLKLEVVAEGAETQYHIDFLRENGCSTVQGFYYSKPLPGPAFRTVLEKGYLEGSRF